MSKDSAQKKRVSRNRVSITYDIETNGGREKVELPFVVGVVGDFSGDKEEKTDIEEREFLLTDKENFDAVIRRIGPVLNMVVENKLSSTSDSFDVNLKFNEIKDFHPDKLIEQIPVLKELMRIRGELKEILGKADRSRAFEKLLKEILSNPYNMEQVAKTLGIERKVIEASAEK